MKHILPILSLYNINNGFDYPSSYILCMYIVPVHQALAYYLQVILNN